MAEKLKNLLNEMKNEAEGACVASYQYDALGEIVYTLSNCSSSLNESAIAMQDSSGVLVECVSDNSKATTLKRFHYRILILVIRLVLSI